MWFDGYKSHIHSLLYTQKSVLSRRILLIGVKAHLLLRRY
jgi:hypothetical protein